MTFYEWLEKQNKRNSPLGDLARDVQVDKLCVCLENTKQAWVSHLESMGACQEAKATLKTAWATYKLGRRAGGRPTLE